MQSKPSRWRSDPYEVAAGRALAAGLGVSPVVGAILARRGFGDLEEARRFLAAERVARPAHAARRPGRLRADPRPRRARLARSPCSATTTSTASAPPPMLLRTLRALGADPVWELPSRFDEGYGLSDGGGRAAGRPRRGAARDGRLRHHRGRAGGRRARGRARRRGHRPPPARRRAARTARSSIPRSATTAARSCARRAWC